MPDTQKTIFKYDAGGGAFKKASIILVSLASTLAVFGYYWIKSWL